MAKRPKRAWVAVEESTVKISSITCPHCMTTLKGFESYVVRMRCWHCDEVIMVETYESPFSKKQDVLPAGPRRTIRSN